MIARRTNENDYVVPPIALLDDYEEAAADIRAASLKRLIESEEFQAAPKLTAVVGCDADGAPQLVNLHKHTHFIIGGQTGTGKTTLLHSIILSLAYKCGPNDVRFVFADPKMMDFRVYKNLPHRLTDESVIRPESASIAFGWACEQMEKRYELLMSCGSANIDDYNARTEVVSGLEKKLPHIVIIVDEFADYAVSSERELIENRVVILAAKARAAGIHLILATQRPSSDVLKGSIKCNVAERIAFKTPTVYESRLILEFTGAEKLSYNGDALYSNYDIINPVRLKSAFVGIDEVKRVVEFLSVHNRADCDAALDNALRSNADCEYTDDVDDPSRCDPLFVSLLKFFVDGGTVNFSAAQRKFSIGYARVARILDVMEQCGFISSAAGNGKPREVLISRAEFEERFLRNSECTIDEVIDFDSNDDCDETDDIDDADYVDDYFDKFVFALDDDDIIDETDKIDGALRALPNAENDEARIGVPEFADDESRKLFVAVLKYVAEKGVASTADVQYKFGLPYVRTMRIFEFMVKYGYIGKREGNSFSHSVNVTVAQVKELFGE